MRLIGISGKIGTGKSTTAQHLVTKGLVDCMHDFGDELKKEVCELFQIPFAACYHDKDRLIFHPDLPHQPMSIRQILQWWGTDVRRAQDPYYWVKKWQAWWRNQIQTDAIVVGDVRFRTEAEELRRIGAWLFRLLPYPEWESGPNAHHQSEIDLDDWDDWDRVISPQYGQLGHVARHIEQVVTGR